MVYCLNLLLIVVNGLILLFFIPFFKCLNLVLKFYKFLRVLSVGSGVLQNDLFSVFDLLFVPVLEIVNLGVSVLIRKGYGEKED